MKLGSEILYLSRADIAACDVPLADVEASVEAMFASKAKGTAMMKPKLALHSDSGWFLAMIGGIKDKGFTGMKWVGVASTQQHSNQPHINGQIVINDFVTGMPVAVMDAQWITGVRTAAISAVGAKYLAKKDSSSIGFVACGLQARTNLDALRLRYPLKRLKAYSRRKETAEAFCAEARKLGMEAVAVDSPKDAMADMDIVVTTVPVVPKPERTFDGAWLAPGSYAAIVDLGHPWKGETLTALDCVVTDDLAQAVTEKLTYPKPYAGEVADLVAGKVQGRKSDKDRTALMFGGLGLADVAVGGLVYETARAKGIGRVLKL